MSLTEAQLDAFVDMTKDPHRRYLLPAAVLALVEEVRRLKDKERQK